MVAGNGSGDSPGNDGSSLVRAPTRAAYSFADTDRAVIFPIRKVATPVNWKQGEDVIIVPTVSDEEAKEKFPGGWKAPRPYLRLVPQPE